MGALELLSSRFYKLVFFATTMMAVLITAQEFLDGPGNKTVVIGETAELRCSVTRSWLFYPPEVLFRHVNDFFRCDVKRALMATPRHTCVLLAEDEDEDGDRYQTTFKLTISDVTLEDAGGYSCIGRGFRPLSALGYLTVLALPDEELLHCLMNDPVSDHKVGADIQITCISSGGLPPAQLSWHQGPNLLAGPSEGPLTYTHRITDADDGLKLTCLLNSSALRDTRNCSVTLDIPPEAEIQPSILEIQSGGNASFRCIGHFFQDVAKQEFIVWNLSYVSKSLDFDHYLRGDMMYLTNVRTTQRVEELPLRCFVSNSSTGSGVWGTATLQIVSVKTTPVSVLKSATPISSETSSSLSGAITLVIVLCSCIPVVLIVTITCLILLRKKKHRREANWPVASRSADNDQRPPSETHYIDLSNKGRTDEPQGSTYQGLVPEYLDLTCPPDPDENCPRPVSEAVYEVTGYPQDDAADSNEHKTSVTVSTGKEDELYVNHVVVKGKQHRGMRK